MNFSNYFVRISNYLKRKLFEVLYYLESRNSVNIDGKTWQTISNSGILMLQSINKSQSDLDIWENANKLLITGQYKRSLNLRLELMNEIYAKYNFEQYPKLMSLAWSQNIGHLGHLATYAKAQELNMIPNQMRILPVYKNDVMKNTATLLFSDLFDIHIFNYPTTIFEMPVFYGFTEKLHLWKNKSGFLDLFEAHELVYGNSEITKENPILKLPKRYCIDSEQKLRELGLPEDSWFVAVHTRYKRNKYDARNFDHKKIIPALNEIVDMGGYVIKFGMEDCPELPLKRNFINLTKEKRDNELDAYVLANSRFLLSSHSGPVTLAWAFGTPVLQINTMAIGHNVLSASKGSIYLPKKWKNAQGEFVSLDDWHSSLLAHWEYDLNSADIRGFSAVENNEDEILNATREMLGLEVVSSELDQKLELLEKIRFKSQTVGKGQFSKSFLGNLPDYMFEIE